MKTKNKNWEYISAPTPPISADKALLHLNESDNIAIATRDIKAKEKLKDVIALAAIPKGHKVATQNINQGEIVRKYSQIIGYAKCKIKKGEHVHVHNLGFQQSNPDYRICKEKTVTKKVPISAQKTFLGYKRKNGQVGTRNYVAIISSVNCSATASRKIADHFTKSYLKKHYPNIDDVVAFIHGSGCGMATDGEGIENLHRVMYGYASHPNVVGVLMLGLGCEVNQLDDFAKKQNLARGPLTKTFNIQAVGGTAKTVELGTATVKRILEKVKKQKRQKISVSELTVALQCGGSDAFSGITANPALGHAVDLLVEQGGTAIIAETPEVYGAEHLLTQRAKSKTVANNLINRIKWWENYCEKNNGSMDNNPTPGNKQGGLTTILEKSLGAVAKGGTTNFNEFLKYAQKVSERGFTMMDSPGFDPVAVTGQIASGSNIVAFTTGRGSAFGSKPAPTLKICTNSDTYRRMSDDMDINAGKVITEGKTVQEVGEEIFNAFIKLASGTPSKSEKQNLGDNEFIPWNIGATM